MRKERESGIPYPVSDEIDDETGEPIQPTKSDDLFYILTLK